MFSGNSLGIVNIICALSEFSLQLTSKGNSHAVPNEINKYHSLRFLFIMNMLKWSVLQNQTSLHAVYCLAQLQKDKMLNCPYLFQLGTLTIGDKHSSEARDMHMDNASSKSTNSSQSGGGGKSIKAMWKRFAFKAAKGQTAGSLPTSVSCIHYCNTSAKWLEMNLKTAQRQVEYTECWKRLLMKVIVSKQTHEWLSVTAIVQNFALFKMGNGLEICCCWKGRKLTSYHGILILL